MIVAGAGFAVVAIVAFCMEAQNPSKNTSVNISDHSGDRAKERGKCAQTGGRISAQARQMQADAEKEDVPIVQALAGDHGREGCKLVLTSSWRLFPDSIRSMFRQFKSFGITKENFFGITSLQDDRGDEVMAYMKRHPQIDRFVALDDQQFFSKRFLQERLILTKEESGITEEIKFRCIAMLNE